jgi:DNA-binding LytR/AlgR family response regulator
MVALFIRQARELSRQKARNELEQRLIAKLQFKLDQNEQQQSPSKILLTSAGKTELVHADLIVYCQAAGDYVEIVLCDNKTHLYSGSLKSIEPLLPNTFIRVHRSYVVNLEYVHTLKSSYNDNSTAVSGSGYMLLNNKQEIPVSRRLMPQVRQAIKQNNA